MPKLPQPKGFRTAGVAAGLKPKGELDVALIVSDNTAVAAGMTTRNRFFAPPVALTRQRLERGKIRAILANSKNANAATGKRGDRDAKTMARLTADALGADSEEIAVNSTGVIGQFLPMDKIADGIVKAADALSPRGWKNAARAIMTTDTYPKDAGAALRIAKTDIAFRGIAKGSGMIHPAMGTMLSYIATDAAIGLPQLRRIVSDAADGTYNAITVDGDTSTSDTVIVMANGAAGGPRIKAGSSDERRFAAALTGVMEELAIHLARDGEGATKLIEVAVAGAKTEAQARAAARKICSSNLVKTAVHGCDANWGRIAMALGNAEAEFDQSRVSIKILGVPVMRRGLPVPYDEPALHKQMRRQKEFAIAVNLGAGKAKAKAWGSDLSYEYVRINADYRT